jgi:epoxyqueuosine reductase QueG
MMGINAEDNYRALKEIAYREGMALFGVANLQDVESEYFTVEDLVRDLRFAISLGYRLSDKVVEGISDRPTRRYFYHYRHVNLLLDQTALKLASYIQAHGFSALPIPASVITDWKEIRGEISHKALAYHAGLGWIGRSTLLVNPWFGSRIRLVSILTNIPLPIDKPIRFGCGDCMECVKACPCSAIGEQSRGFDVGKCLEKLREFARLQSFGTQYICGICLRVCIGKRKISANSS